MKHKIEFGAKDKARLKLTGLDQISDVIPAKMLDIAIRHIRKILTALCVLILAVVVWGGYITYRDHEESKAALLLADAISGEKGKNTTDLLKKLVQKYSHTQAGRQAMLMLGSAYRDAGQIDKAIDAFSMAKKQFPKDSVLFATSSLGIGYLNEDKHIFTRAIKEFTDAAYNKAFSSIATLDLARVLAVSGDKDRAFETYNRYLSITKEPAELDFVRYKVMELSKGDKIRPTKSKTHTPSQ
ncbi:MAG: tetratricopeptide repeat protein [Dissulfurimicrobium sp.]|uniref:tetratricopeptide repeat protein n=1 Tax=Dissulfurimicrobium sp. TaxID=2022436 RepID=UPI00404980C2